MAELLGRRVAETVGAVIGAFDVAPLPAFIGVCRESLDVAGADRAARREDLDLAAVAADGVAVRDLGGALDVDVEDFGDGSRGLGTVAQAGRGVGDHRGDPGDVGQVDLEVDVRELHWHDWLLAQQVPRAVQKDRLLTGSLDSATRSRSL